MSTVTEPSYQELVDYVAGCGAGVLETRQALLAQHERLHTQLEQQEAVASEQTRLLGRELLAIEGELKELCDTALPKVSGDVAEKLNAVMQRVGALEGRMQTALSKGQEQTHALLTDQRSQTGSALAKLETQINRSVEGLHAALQKQDQTLTGTARQVDARTSWLSQQMNNRFSEMGARHAENQQYVRLMADGDDKRHAELTKRLSRIMFVLVLCLIGVWYQVWTR